MKKLLITLASLLACGTALFADDIPEPIFIRHGDIAGNVLISTNQDAINTAIVTKLNNKLDKLIFDSGFDYSSPCWKATLALASDTDHVAPRVPFVYLVELAINSRIYDSEKLPVPDADNGGFTVIKSGDSLKLQGVNTLNHMDTWSFDTEEIDGMVLKVASEEKNIYGYSHPYDWRVLYEAMDDTETHEESFTTAATNSAQQIYNTYITRTTKNNKARVYVDYLDEVNLPLFSFVDYTIEYGPATLNGDILTATSAGIVGIRGIASDGEERVCEVPMFSWTSEKSTSRYDQDATAKTWGVNRKRVNDYMSGLLETYRANPVTNREYKIDSNYQHAYAEDMYQGNYGRRFFPYQHVSVLSDGHVGTAGNGRYAHAPISKHLMIAAAHWGGALTTEYFNYDEKFSGKKAVRGGQWIGMANWAKQHGFADTDTLCGDMAIIVLRDGDEIPDECLPYIATADYLNATYGVDVENPNGTYLPGLSFCQADMVLLRNCSMGGYWGSSYGGPVGNAAWSVWDEALHRWVTIDNYRVRDFRYDLYTGVGKGCWHSVVGGDSGHPTYIFDPNLKTGLTDTDGTELLRPILICAYHTAGGSTSSVPKFTKIIKAFADSIGEELPYTLGNLSAQSSDIEVIKQNAIDAMNQ